MPEGTNDSARPPGGLRQKAVRGVFWTAVEKWSVRLSTLAGFIVLGNLLTPRAFGVVALASTFITILTTVSDAGFSAYLLQAKRITQASTSTAFFTTAGIALVFAGLLAALSGPISVALHSPGLGSVLPALAFSLVASGFSSVPAMLLRRQLRFKDLAMRNVSATVLSIVAAIVLAVLGAGVWALVAQTIVRNLVALVVLWSKSDFRPSWTFDRVEAKAMTTYGVQSLAVSLGNQLRGQGEVFFIGALAGSTALGYWTVGGRLVSFVVDVCTSIINSVAGPVFARVQDDPKRLARAVGAANGMGNLVVVPGLVILSLVSKQLVPAVFGHHWLPAAAVASMLAMRSLVRALGEANRSVLMATGHPRAELIVTVTMLVVQIGLVLVFARVGLVPLAAALAVGVGLTIPIRMVLVRRYHAIPLSVYAPATGVLLAGGVAAGVVVALQTLLQLPDYPYIALAVVVGAAVYSGVVFLVCRPLLEEALGTLRGGLARRRRTRVPTAL